jgi:hypothetical protein
MPVSFLYPIAIMLLSASLGPINAANLSRAHARIWKQRAPGRMVMIGLQSLWLGRIFTAQVKPNETMRWAILKHAPATA